MNAALLHVRQGHSRSPSPRQSSLARNKARLAAENARPKISTAAFQTSVAVGGGNGDTKGHDGSSPLVLQAAAETSLRLEERAGRVYATAEMQKGNQEDDDLLLPVGPPLPSGVFLAGAELRPGTAYLLSPGAEISFTDRSSGARASVTVTYEVKENDGVGGLGEMLARAMAAQASDDVRAKLDDVF